MQTYSQYLFKIHYEVKFYLLFQFLLGLVINLIESSIRINLMKTCSQDFRNEARKSWIFPFRCRYYLWRMKDFKKYMIYYSFRSTHPREDPCLNFRFSYFFGRNNCCLFLFLIQEFFTESLIKTFETFYIFSVKFKFKLFFIP